MSYAVLVLTDDNFAPVNTSDDRLVHGFSLNERFDTLHDWRLSPYGSHTMALGALLARHVRISAADLYGSCDQEQASPDLSALTVEQLQEDELWSAARFYTMSEFSSGQIDYICAHFDAICLFLNHPLDEHCTFPLTISSLLLAPNCPPSFIFNLCLAPELTNPHSTVIPKLSLQLFLQQALPQAYLVHTLDPNAGCVQVVPPERPGAASETTCATSAAAAAGRNAENKAGRNEESWAGARAEERPQWRLKSSFNALFFFQPQATRRALARLEQVLAPGGDAPVIALSSTLFTRHARLGLSPEALALCQALRQLWPKAHLVVVLGKGIFSYAPLYSDATWLLSEQPPRWGNMAAHWCTELNAALLQHARTQAALSCGEVSASEVCVPEAAAQPWIEGCFLGHSYEEYQHFLAEVDLLITEYACEQVLAASCGTPTLGLTLDLNLEEPIALSYYAAFRGRAPNDAELGAEYEALARSGMLSRGAKVGTYQELSAVSFGTNTIFPSIKLSALKADAPQARAAALVQLNALRAHSELSLGRPQGLNQAWQYALAAKVANLHPQEQLSALRAALGVMSEVPAGTHHGSALKVAQRANFTGMGRYDVQLQALKTLVTHYQSPSALQELTVMSFGCSTGQELTELRGLLGTLGSHHYLGVDICADALAQARILWHNLEVMPKILPARSGRFVTTAQLVAQLTAEQGATAPAPWCDVICAMTVLCRHPETVRLENAQGVYDWADFEATVALLDRCLKPGGLLVLFNANYRFEDLALSAHYQRVFPAQDRLELVQLLSASPALAKAFDRAAAPGPQSLTAALFGYVPTFKPTGERWDGATKGTIFLKRG